MLYSEPRHHRCRIAFVETRGHHLAVLENEVLRVSVLLSKGADIVEFRYKPADLDLLWHGPLEPYPAGRYVEPVARAQGSFLDYFQGGWQELFPNGGFACTYEGASLGQHGEVSVLPWHARVDVDEPERISVTVWVDTVRMPFRIQRTLTLTSGSPVLDVRWRVRNRGQQRVHYSWGQHPGFGPPLLTDGSVIDLPGGMVCTSPTPLFENFRLAPGQRTAWPHAQDVGGGLARVDQVLGATARTHDVLWVTDLTAGWAALRTPARGLGFGLRWDIQTFPHLWCWQVYGGLFGYPTWGDMYHLALEPFSGPFGTLVENIESGQALALDAGANHDTWLQAGVLVGDEARQPFSGTFSASEHLADSAS
jgi:hypothetical protein